MSKNKSKKRKQNDSASHLPNKHLKTASKPITPPLDADDRNDDAASKNGGEPTSLHTVVSQEELEITVETLAELAKHPALLKSRACKDLRVAVWDFRQACPTGLNSTSTSSNLTGRITAALADGKLIDAKVLLAEMRIRGEEPKLGALCRWVRDLDVISGVSTVEGEVTDRSARDRELISVLDGVLRVCGVIDTNPDADFDPSSPIAVQEIWDLRTMSSAPTIQTYASVLDKTIFLSAPPKLSESIRVIETTPGPLRKPPNHHDAILYTTKPGGVPLSATPPPISYHHHPVVPGLSLATRVLSPSECQAIIAAGETVNFLPDAPLREDGDISVLAHNFYWVVDQLFHDTLWSRISPYVPSSVDGRLARGLNRRFRVYRYVPGAEYRAHIDGAWPPSGILPDDTYVYDASPPGKKQSSLFTFLIYLNDEFEGGETTFFLPSAREGVLNAYPVRPVMGGVAIFPHGDTRGALLHEGTGVRKGAKYVIRTEVEYDIEPTVAVTAV
ncbi:hypothetical protein B0T16DRAFT_457095 [Cercophora newfieldiana]|uniref:Fe2OG dioxygenase domain-containing protein n=1 Tax=Cercophora newfieldiana TaxID=92897 RepID=A0AA39YDV7_9PEZI|nr:hypothetical protein B0T16DRAFT_457095 [Cercophora newfieldiana]